MNDILPSQVSLWLKLEKTARDLFAAYGFSEIRTPIMEDTPLFSRGIGEGTQVVQKEMYTFIDRGGDSVTLRPEGTAGVIRAYIEHNLAALDAITKIYCLGPMFRYERPQKGRLRQFHQISVEVLGIDSPHADAEVVIMLQRLVRALGIFNYRLEVNTLGSFAERSTYLKLLSDFLAGLKMQLCEECQGRIEKNPMRVLDCKKTDCQHLVREAPLIINHVSEQTRDEFKVFCNALDAAGVEYKVNPRIVRGLDYYEKTSFEFVSDDLGSQNAFAGGGRYNSLVKELGGDDAPGVGFAIGCERVIMLLEQALTQAAVAAVHGVYFAVFDDKGAVAARPLMQSLRDAGITAEMDYTIKSLKSQLRRASKLGYRYVAIIGDEEINNNVVMLKDMASGEQRQVDRLALINCLNKK